MQLIYKLLRFFVAASLLHLASMLLELKTNFLSLPRSKKVDRKTLMTFTEDIIAGIIKGGRNEERPLNFEYGVRPC